jgi:hypothetical protein
VSFARPFEIGERPEDESIGAGALLLAGAVAAGPPATDAARPAAACPQQLIGERLAQTALTFFGSRLSQAPRNMASCPSQPTSQAFMKPGSFIKKNTQINYVRRAHLWH